MATHEDSEATVQYTGDLHNATFVEADLTGARIRDCDLTGLKVADSWLIDLDLSGEVRNLVVNEVRVDQYVSDELDRRHPIRVQLREARTVADYRAAWQQIEQLWDEAVHQAEQLPESLRQQQVDGEWSFVQTMRHLVFATDGWIASTVLDEPGPFHPQGLPHSGHPADAAAAVGIDPHAHPSFAETLTVRRQRQALVRDLLARLTDAELEELRERPPAPGYPVRPRTVRACIGVIMKEECEHHRYATRDLARLRAGAPDAG